VRIYSETLGSSQLNALYSSYFGNQAPTFTASPINKADADEGVAYSGSIAGDATDPDGDPLTFFKQTGAAWLTVSTDGTLSGTPGALDVGGNAFTVLVVDSVGALDTATLNITVIAAPNQAPSFTAPPINKADADEGVAYSGSIAGDASDPDGDQLTFSLVTMGTWLSVSTDGTLSGTPTAGDIGTNVFTVQVLDQDDASDTATLNITVVAANLAPSFTAPPINKADATEGTAYSASIAGDATDPEGDPMTFSKVSGSAWLNVASDGTLSGTPGVGDVGENIFFVQVSALGGTSASAPLLITVVAAPPVLPPDLTVGAPIALGSDITLSWIGENGVSYGVQTNDDLVNGTWNSYITNFIGNGGMLNFTNDLDVDELFFRVYSE